MTETRRPSDLLGGDGKGLLALALAEIELGEVGDENLDDAVGELSRDELVEPDSIEAGMLVSDFLENPLPDRRVKRGLFGAARQRLALTTAIA